MLHAAVRSQEVNPAKLRDAVPQAVRAVPGQGGRDASPCVSDLGTRREYIAGGLRRGRRPRRRHLRDVRQLDPVLDQGRACRTIGKCKGTLEAVKAADMVVIFHVPLFTKWLKEVMNGGTRVLMIIDAPDDLEQLMSPPGLKEAVLARRRAAREDAARCASPATPAPTSPIAAANIR